MTTFMLKSDGYSQEGQAVGPNFREMELNVSRSEQTQRIIVNLHALTDVDGRYTSAAFLSVEQTKELVNFLLSVVSDKPTRATGPGL